MGKTQKKVFVVGEHDHRNPCHAYVNASLRWAARQLEVELSIVWRNWTEIGTLEEYGAIWVIDSANDVGAQAQKIIDAKLSFQQPLLITGEAFFNCSPWLTDGFCGELASSNIAVKAAGQVNHAPIYIARNSRLFEHLGLTRSHEHCNHTLALNLSKEYLFNKGHLRIVARDGRGDVQAIERIDQPFCIATVFSPESRMMYGVVHPLIYSFVNAAISAQFYLEQGKLAASA